MVLDTSSHSQITHLSVENCDITNTPDGVFAYLSDCDSSGPDIIKIQTSDHTVAEIIRLRGILPPANDITVSPNGIFLYIIHESDKSLSVMRISDNFFIQNTLPIFKDSPRNIVFTPDGERAFTTQFNPQDNLYELVVINTTDVNNITVEKIVPLRGNVVDIALTPKGDFIYMTIDLGPSHEVAIIRTSDYATLPPIPLETNLVGIAITPDGNFAYVAIHGAFPEDGNEVAVIDTRTNTIVDRISTNTNPGFTAITEAPTP
jgi:DNA-binding beta-propeller fold protein YncE